MFHTRTASLIFHASYRAIKIALKFAYLRGERSYARYICALEYAQRTILIVNKLAYYVRIELFLQNNVQWWVGMIMSWKTQQNLDSPGLFDVGAGYITFYASVIKNPARDCNDFWHVFNFNFPSSFTHTHWIFLSYRTHEITSRPTPIRAHTTKIAHHTLCMLKVAY